MTKRQSPEDQHENQEMNRIIARLAHETLEEWTRRFFRERGIPDPTEAEMREFIQLSDDDTRSMHQ